MEHPIATFIEELSGMLRSFAMAEVALINMGFSVAQLKYVCLFFGLYVFAV